jgi:hypothetical protein
MGITCETIWHESSNYLEGDIAPELRIAMNEHIRGCKECASVMDGLRNVVTLYGDERMSELPVGFSQRLQRKLEANKPPTRRQFFGWAVAFAASVVAVGSFELLHHTTQEKAGETPHKPKPVPPECRSSSPTARSTSIAQPALCLRDVPTPAPSPPLKPSMKASGHARSV